MSWYVVGIDNGYSGYVCLMERGSRRYTLKPTPLQAERLCRPSADLWSAESSEGSRDYDFMAMQRLLKTASVVSKGAVVAVIEEPISRSTDRKTNFDSVAALIRGFGLWSGACALAEIPLFSIAPTSWKADLGLRRVDSTDLKIKKQQAIDLAMTYGATLPKIEYKLAPRPGQKTPRLEHSHDAAEAFLLAVWLAEYTPVVSWE